MLVNRHRPDFCSGVPVGSSRSFCDESGLPPGIPGALQVSNLVEVPRTSDRPGSKDHLRFGLTSAASPPAQWKLLDSNDREVFGIWALRVAVLYSSLLAALLGAMLLGVYVSGDRQDAPVQAVRGIAR
jgi:hypothetical protein